MQNGGHYQISSCFWYQGEVMPDGSPAEFHEDAAHPIKDFSQVSGHSPSNARFTYCDVDIDKISQRLGIPWEPSKTVPFSFVIPYLGFEWNLSEHTMVIPECKKTKYKAAIKEWLICQTHNLDEAQKLYGKLLHACLVLPAGRTYLTCLEGLLASFGPNPLVPTTPLAILPLTSLGGSMSSVPQQSLAPSQAQPLSPTGVHSLMPVQVLVSALLSATSGERGSSSQDGRQMVEISDGRKPLGSSSSSDPSL